MVQVYEAALTKTSALDALEEINLIQTQTCNLLASTIDMYKIYPL